MIERERLLTLLAEVEPALPAGGLVPVMKSFWFTGKRLLAFNGRIAISVPCKVPFAGAVPRNIGKLLRTTAAKQLEFETDKDTLIIKAASGRIKLPMVAPDAFVFDMPALSDDDSGFPADGPRMLQAIEACMFSIPKVITYNDQLGVTLIAGDNTLHMFATDGGTLTHGTVKLKKPVPFTRVILPTEFCKQLLRIGKGQAVLDLEINKTFAMLHADGVVLWGGLIEPDDKALPFLKVLNEIVPKDFEDAAVEMPPKFKDVLDRHAILTDNAMSTDGTHIVVRGDHMTFKSKSERGSAEDAMKIDTRHGDVDVWVDAGRLKDALPRFDRVLISNDNTVMRTGNNITHVALNKKADD